MKKALAIFLSLWLAVPVHAAVTFDAVATGTYDGSAGPFEFSWSHTVGTGANYLTVCVAHTTGGAVSSITLGGSQSLSLLEANLATTNGAEVWALKNPAVGAGTILVTMAASVNAAAGSISWAGVNLSTPTGTITEADDLAGAITVDVEVDTNGLAFDCLYTSNAPTPVVGAGQTSRFNLTSPTPNVTASGSTEPGPGTITMSWSSTDAEVGKLIAVPLKPASRPAATPMVLP